MCYVMRQRWTRAFSVNFMWISCALIIIIYSSLVSIITSNLWNFVKRLNLCFSANLKLILHDCIVWNTHNTVFGSKRSAICALAVYYVHSTWPWPSVTWLNSRWVPATDWCQRYLPCRQPAPDVAENWGLLYGVYRPGEWVWIDSNGKNGNKASRKGIIW